VTGRTSGIDTGGTFTDLWLDDGSGPRVAKLPSTPHDPARAVLDGLALVGGAGARDHVVHGTTVALNGCSRATWRGRRSSRTRASPT
jgi:N-methylhydantoinase A